MWHHLLPLLPIVGLALFCMLPWSVALPAYAALAAVSVVVFAAALRALRLPVKTGTEGMVGKAARVVEPLRPQGVVRYGGELWQAVADEPLEPGTWVRITRVNGMTLQVRRASRAWG